MHKKTHYENIFTLGALFLIASIPHSYATKMSLNCDSAGTQGYSSTLDVTNQNAIYRFSPYIRLRHCASVVICDNEGGIATPSYQTFYAHYQCYSSVTRTVIESEYVPG